MKTREKNYSSKKPVGLGLSKTKWEVVAQGKHNKEGNRYILTLRDMVEWIETIGDRHPSNILAPCHVGLISDN